jgi:sigma-B regulation protein RsbU (phosphoserine phosphatase)
VSGKGLTAAVHTAMATHTMRAYALEDSEPSSVLSRMCDAMQVLTPETLFVTLIYGVLDTAKRKFTYASAGHDPPILVRAGHADILDLEATGPALGIGVCFEYAQGEVELIAGDVLVFYTDGLTEARLGGEMFGVEGIERVVREKADLPLDELSQRIIHAASEFAGGDLRDDIALLVIRAE